MAVARVPAPGCGEPGESTGSTEHPGTGQPPLCPTAAPHRNASGGQGTGLGVLVRARRLTGNPGPTATHHRGHSARKATGERNILQSNGAGVGDSFPVAGIPPRSLRPTPPAQRGRGKHSAKRDKTAPLPETPTQINKTKPKSGHRGTSQAT